MTDDPGAEPPPLSRFELARGQAAALERELSNLLTGEEHYVIMFFMRLAVDTLELLPAGRARGWARMDATSIACPVNGASDLDALPEHVRLGWRAWPAIWADLVGRNPRLRLADMLSTLGGSIDARSWILGHQETITAWVDRGKRLPLPWPSAPTRDEEVGPGFYAELRRLRADTGGWVHHDEALGRRVFRTDAGVGS